MRFTTMKGAEILPAGGTGMAEAGLPGDAVTAMAAADRGPGPPEGESALPPWRSCSRAP